MKASKKAIMWQLQLQRQHALAAEAQSFCAQSLHTPLGNMLEALGRSYHRK